MSRDYCQCSQECSLTNHPNTENLVVWTRLELRAGLLQGSKQSPPSSSQGWAAPPSHSPFPRLGTKVSNSPLKDTKPWKRGNKFPPNRLRQAHARNTCVAHTHPTPISTRMATSRPTPNAEGWATRFLRGN